MYLQPETIPDDQTVLDTDLTTTAPFFRHLNSHSSYVNATRSTPIPVDRPGSHANSLGQQCFFAVLKCVYSLDSLEHYSTIMNSNCYNMGVN